MRWHATYYLNYFAYWCNAKISALLSIGVPKPQLLYTIPKTGIFPYWYNASWQCDNMPLWVLAICHKAVLFAKGEILSLCVSLYTLCSKAENHLHIPMPGWYTCRLFWGLKLKTMLFNIEGTNISKHHVLKYFWKWNCFFLNVTHPNQSWQNLPSDTWAGNAFLIINLYLWDSCLWLYHISINVEMFAQANVSNIFKPLSKI